MAFHLQFLSCPSGPKKSLKRRLEIPQTKGRIQGHGSDRHSPVQMAITGEGTIPTINIIRIYTTIMNHLSGEYFFKPATNESDSPITLHKNLTSRPCTIFGGHMVFTECQDDKLMVQGTVGHYTHAEGRILSGEAS